MLSLKYLKNKEWSMGNGQCPECHGVSQEWLGHPLHLNSKNIGHKSDCLLANSLKELGDSPIFIGDYISKDEYENWIDDNGFYGTRIKTINGCPKINKINQEFQNIFYKSLVAEMNKGVSNCQKFK